MAVTGPDGMGLPTTHRHRPRRPNRGFLRRPHRHRHIDANADGLHQRHGLGVAFADGLTGIAAHRDGFIGTHGKAAVRADLFIIIDADRHVAVVGHRYFLVMAHGFAAVMADILFGVMADVFGEIIADLAGFVVLDQFVMVLLRLKIDLFRPGLVFEPQLVPATAARAGIAFPA